MKIQMIGIVGAGRMGRGIAQVQLDLIVRPDTVTTSNSLSVSLTKLGATLSNPGRFTWLHFFNPCRSWNWSRLSGKLIQPAPPHSSLRYRPPLEFEQLHAQTQTSSHRGLPTDGQRYGRERRPAARPRRTLCLAPNAG